MDTVYKNLFYFANINSIGGIETFFWNLVRKYEDWDITICYTSADPDQLKRLEQYARVIKFTGQHIKCEKAFFNYDTGIIDYVEAKEYNLLIHADYKAQNIRPLPIHPKIDHYYAVSKQTQKAFEEVSGLKVWLLYNPFIQSTPRKMLNLISTTRLTAEKGRGRMEQLAKALENADIPFTWTVFTNSTMQFNSQNIILRKPKLDIINYVANADYLVQLSDSEAFSYSIIEALSVGTPCIITDLPVAKEMGVINGQTGFILPFDMSEIPIDEIYKGLPPFDYKPREDKYSKVLVKGESTYKRDLKSLVTVKCINSYFDLELNRLVKEGEIWKVNKVRAGKLMGINGVEVIDDIS